MIQGEQDRQAGHGEADHRRDERPEGASDDDEHGRHRGELQPRQGLEQDPPLLDPGGHRSGHPDHGIVGVVVAVHEQLRRL